MAANILILRQKLFPVFFPCQTSVNEEYITYIKGKPETCKSYSPFNNIPIVHVHSYPFMVPCAGKFLLLFFHLNSSIS